MEIIGTIQQILPVEQGVSKTGNQWQKQTVVIAYGEQYPKQLALTLIGDRVTQNAPLLVPGTARRFHFDPSSREYNGKWYTECVAWKVADPYQPQQQPQAQPQYSAFPPQQTPPPTPYQQAEMMYNNAHPQPQPYTGTDTELPF